MSEYADGGYKYMNKDVTSKGIEWTGTFYTPNGGYESSGCKNCGTPTKFFKDELGKRTYTSLHCRSIPNVIASEVKMSIDDREADMSEGNEKENSNVIVSKVEVPCDDESDIHQITEDGHLEEVEPYDDINSSNNDDEYSEEGKQMKCDHYYLTLSYTWEEVHELFNESLHTNTSWIERLKSEINMDGKYFSGGSTITELGESSGEDTNCDFGTDPDFGPKGHKSGTEKCN